MKKIIFILAFLILIPVMHSAQIDCKFEPKSGLSSASACTSGRHPIADFYKYNDSHISRIDSLASGNLTLCCTFVNSSSFFSNTACPSDYDSALLRTQQNNNSAMALPDQTQWGNYYLCLNNTPDFIDVESNNASPLSPGYGLALRLNMPNNSHAQAPNFTDYNNTLWIANVPNAPIIIVKAVRNDTFNITWTDTSEIESWFIAYANRTPKPTNVVVVNISTNTGTAGTRYTNKTNGPDSNDGSCGATTFCPNQSYFIRARFNDSDGDFSMYSQEIKKWTLSSPPNLSNRTIINGPGDVDVNVSWDNSDLNPADTKYRIEWSNTPKDANSWRLLCETNGSTGANPLSSTPPLGQRWCYHDNVNEGLQHCYRGYAQNGDGFWNFRLYYLDTEQEPSTTGCGAVPNIITSGVNAWFDPSIGTGATNSIYKTYLFIENDGNAPDNYSLSYNYESAKITLGKHPSSAYLRAGPRSVDRFEVEINFIDVQTDTPLTVTVTSRLNQSKSSTVQFIAKQTKIIGVDGPGWKEILITALLAAAILLI